MADGLGFQGGNLVTSDRWQGILEWALATPVGLSSVILGRIAMIMSLGLLGFFLYVGLVVVVADHVFAYAADLVRATRPREPGVPKFIPELVSWGAGPRASQYLILGGKARALLYGRVHVQTEDIQELARPVLRHRILTNFTAVSEGISPDVVIKKLIDETPDKESELSRDERFRKIFAS